MPKPIHMNKTIASLLLCFALTSTAIFAQSKDETQVADKIETLRKALITPDSAVLAGLAADQLTYGHSTGLIEDKAAFISDLLTSKTRLISAVFADQTIKFSGNVAIARCHMTGETVVHTPVDLIVLMIWQKQKGEWKILARQAAKIPPPAK